MGVSPREGNHLNIKGNGRVGLFEEKVLHERGTGLRMRSLECDVPIRETTTTSQDEREDPAIAAEFYGIRGGRLLPR